MIVTELHTIFILILFRLFTKIVGEVVTEEHQTEVDGQRGYKVKCGGVSCVFEFEAYRFCGHDEPASTTASPDSRRQPPETRVNMEERADAPMDSQSGSTTYSTPPTGRADSSGTVSPGTNPAGSSASDSCDRSALSNVRNGQNKNASPQRREAPNNAHSTEV